MKNNILKTVFAIALICSTAMGCSSTKEGTSTSDSTINSTDSTINSPDSAGMSGTSVPDTVVRDSM